MMRIQITTIQSAPMPKELPSNGDSDLCSILNFANQIAPKILVFENSISNLLKALRMCEEKTFVIHK